MKNNVKLHSQVFVLRGYISLDKSSHAMVIRDLLVMTIIQPRIQNHDTKQ